MSWATQFTSVPCCQRRTLIFFALRKGSSRKTTMTMPPPAEEMIVATAERAARRHLKLRIAALSISWSLLEGSHGGSGQKITAHRLTPYVLPVLNASQPHHSMNVP